MNYQIMYFSLKIIDYKGTRSSIKVTIPYWMLSQMTN